MPSNSEQKASLSRLKALFGVIYAEAEKNPEFLLKLEDIILSTDAVVKNKSRISSKKNEPAINPIEVLQVSGKDQLLKELNNLTNDEIIKIITTSGIRKLKDARNISHQELITLIVEYSEKKLNQGGSFLKNS